MCATSGLSRLASTSMKGDRPPHEQEGERRQPDTSDSGHPMEQICCWCFKFIQGDEPNHADEEQLREELFCSPCQAALAGSLAVGGHTVALFPTSPLPKLSLLVQTEARYQGQLQALKQQQDLLLQQQELLRASKQAQLDQVARERELARERRRQFQMVTERRKREEELKYIQFASESKIASREENQDGGGSSNEDAPGKPKQKKVARPSPAGTPSLPPPITKPATPTTTTLPELDAGSSHEQMQQQQRNKQRLLTMGCYAQDLTPLVDGDRPKRLPMPIPSVYVADSKKKPQRQAAAAIASGGANRLQAKTKAKKTLRLHPLGKGQSPHSSNTKAHVRGENENQQQEEQHEFSIAVPRYRTHGFGAPSAPLTAEIKPAAWIYELGKDVMGEEDAEDQSPDFSSKVHTKSFAVGNNNLSSTLARLTSVPEELDQLNDMDPADSSAMSAKYQSHAKPSAPAMPSSTPSSWEYSTERLTSLLEKYKVSVTTDANGSRV